METYVEVATGYIYNDSTFYWLACAQTTYYYYEWQGTQFCDELSQETELYAAEDVEKDK